MVLTPQLGESCNFLQKKVKCRTIETAPKARNHLLEEHDAFSRSVDLPCLVPVSVRKRMPSVTRRPPYGGVVLTLGRLFGAIRFGRCLGRLLGR